jgi:serine/threonine protein kinase
VTTFDENALQDSQWLERYELGARIAAGGFGDIYQATQRSTGQEVAVKVLRLDREEGEEARERLERFHRETRLCAALHHPNIVRLIDSGRASAGAVYAVFELVSGNNLADVLAAEGALEPAEALHLMGQVLDALACAHAEGVVHRDLKPENIMVTDTGARRNALVLDFGLGTFITGAGLGDLPRLTRGEEYLGTPGYSAPEQLRGEPVSPATDLFAWGLIVLECLTGEPALDGTIPQVVHRLLGPDGVPIPAPLLDRELGRILASVTDKDVARREGSAEHVLMALQKVLLDPLPTREELDRSRGIREPLAREAHVVSQLSHIWLVPLRRNPNFTGREGLLGELAASLRQRGRLAIAALRGLGGVGKSQLALEYAYRHANDYDLVAWLRAEEPETLSEDFASLAEALGLPERETPVQQSKVAAVRAWLERNDNWLVIFDNASNPDSIRSFLPRTTMGHMLVTSRHQSWRELGVSVAVDEMDPEEAVEFLLRRTGETDRAAAARLAEDLGRLPLALEGAAAYMETTGRSLKTYLPLLRDQQRVLLAGPRAADYPATLGGAWEISFRHLEEETQEAADLLRLCAFLAPDDIPFELLRGGREHLPQSLAQVASDPIRFDECVAALRRYSLVKVEEDALAVHRLVQLVTRERLPETDRRQWAGRALRVAEVCFPTSGTAGDFQPEALLRDPCRPPPPPHRGLPERTRLPRPGVSAPGERHPPLGAGLRAAGRLCGGRVGRSRACAPRAGRSGEGSRERRTGGRDPRTPAGAD